MRKAAAIMLLLLAAGCARGPVQKSLTPSEAHQKLVSILKEENALAVVTKEFDNALWIYLPLGESFLEMKAKKKPAPPPSSAPTTPTVIHFLEGGFNGKDFVIQYDIGPAKKYVKDYGYTSAFTEEYQIKQQSILTAISRAYADFEDVPGEDRLAERVPGDVDFIGEEKNAAHKRMVHAHVNTPKAPNIFVIVIADIESGIEATTILHLKDLKRAYTDQTFHGEYAKRVVSEQPAGHPGIVGDKDGRHVGFRDIRLPEFLAKQMIFRVNFKYTRSAFPPEGTPKEEILRACADTVMAYDFTDFNAIELQDLSDGAFETVRKEELSQYAEEPSEGKLIHIKFR